MPFLINIVQGLMIAVWLAVLGRVIMSWVDPHSIKPVSQFLFRVTEPILAPIRGVLPRSGQFDMSPFVFLVGLGFAMRVTLTL